MNARYQNTTIALKSKVVHNQYGATLEGTFSIPLTFENTTNDLDNLETQIELAGQEFKRQTCKAALEAADQRCSNLVQQTQPHLIKNGKPTFTIVTQFGEVKIKRQRLKHTKTGKTFTPSAILWQTTQRRHITKAVQHAACDASQEVSYKKAAERLAEKAGTDSLISTTTVWNIKQEKGKELEQQQNDFVLQVQSGQNVTLPVGIPSNSTRSIEEGKIQVQLDEIKTRSQESGKKWNNTYTATIETADKQCYRLAARSVSQLTLAVMSYLILLGYLDKSLEVISDGATWISDWVKSITAVPVEQVLCWYHLSKRVYESLGALGWSKSRRELLEREILGLLWKGKTAEVVWLLWDLRFQARVPERIDGLMGYLLRKRRIIVDYSVRREANFWLASTRVEKWNDIAVADRCKDNGMSWTIQGVLAIALYAAKYTHTTT